MFIDGSIYTFDLQTAPLELKETWQPFFELKNILLDDAQSYTVSRSVVCYM